MPNAHDRFASARLSVITCPPPEGAEGYAAQVRAACEGGADVLQFRDKLLSIRERYGIALELAEICYEHKTLFIVNDMIDLAVAVGADGVHLGQDDLPTEAARELARRFGAKDFLIGRSTHSLEQAQFAEREHADYIAVGPVFATPTKPSYKPVGLDLVRSVNEQVKTPQVAIGGIDASNVQQVLDAGTRRIAVVRAVCGAADVRAAAHELKERLAP
jgi:thiamine-phosphate pyrophosphorylase